MRKVAISMDELVPLLMLQLETSGSANLNVTGFSMLPMLHSHKDSVKLAPADQMKGKRELILYRRDNGVYVLHRILREKKDGYVCCGDNQFVTERIRKDQILAVVTEFTRNGKTYPVDHRGYRFYVWCWVTFHPLRWVYLVPRRFAGWVRAKIRRLKRR